ncbi:FadR/GntR family transcriptional regulator [Paeniglutamicibacter antarcticus]|uniref:GntR family transcriptional regulator n=1 Tax=Paeniglutamicibacter antarcticus TaxID=494023 RepID=A0ABP9TRH8_9MICC
MATIDGTPTEIDPKYRLLGMARKGNAFEETVEQLLRGIKIGIFAPGERLPAERELAEALGVSRATLRDALAELQKAQYLTIQRGRYGGAFVTDTPPARSEILGWQDHELVEDVLAFRSVVEPAAAAMAADSSLTAAQRTSLLDALNAVSNATPGQYRPLDARLHICIAELTPSRRLAAAVAEARAATSDLLDRIPFLERNIEHSEEQHRAIVDAILGGNPASARTLMEEHLAGTTALLRGFLAGERQTHND